MTNVAGRQVEVEIAIEASAGTPVAPTKWLQWDSFNFQAVSEKELFQSARGIRNKISNSKITRLYGKGAIEFAPTPETLPYILALAMGSISTAAHSGESAVYDHTATINNTNGSMKTATITQK